MATRTIKRKPTIYKCSSANPAKKPTYKFNFDGHQYHRAKKVDAIALMNEIYTNYLNEIGYDMPTNETIGNAIQKWLPTTRGSVEATTYDRKDGLIRHYIVPLLGDIQIFALERKDIQNALITMADHQNLSRSTCKQMRHCLHQFYVQNNYLEKMRINPFVGLRDPRNRADYQSKLKFFTHEEMQLICRESMRMKEDGTPLYRWGPAICIVAQSGIRSGEMVGLTWKCVNFKNRSFEILMTRQKVANREAQSSDEPKRKTITQKPKSECGKRILFMTDTAKAAFEILQKYATPQDAYVLPNQSHESLDASVLRRTLQKILDSLIQQGHEEFKDKPFGLHALRHGFATYMINEERAPITVVSRWLGHATVDVTVNTYVHTTQKDFCQMVKNIDI